MIPIQLDKMRHLKLTPNAVADAEASMGKNLNEIVKEGGIRATRVLLWSGLKWEDRSLTLEKVGKLIEKWMDEKPYSELEAIIAEALIRDGWYREMKRQNQEDEQGKDDGVEPVS